MCDSLADKSTPYGHVLQHVPLPCTDGKVWMLVVQAFWPALYTVAKQSAGFAALIRSQLQRVGPPTLSKPWRLVLYTDEVDPGDPLSPEHGRKVQACYWSIMEFGAAALSEEDAWFTAFTARTKKVQLVSIST